MFKGEFWPEKDYPEKDEFGWAESKIGGKRNCLFHIHQSYEKRKDTVTLYCKKCKGNQFHVGQGHCFTTIKCVKCGWEEMIHEG